MRDSSRITNISIRPSRNTIRKQYKSSTALGGTFSSRETESTLILNVLFCMKKQEIYTNYLVKIKSLLEKDDFWWLDYALEFMYFEVAEKDRNAIEEILQEATLYAELKEKDYKDTALSYIADFEKSLIAGWVKL